MVTGNAEACDGDSGGSAYLANSTGRTLLGVISAKSALVCNPQDPTHITDLASPQLDSFIHDWKAKFPDATMCGIDAMPNCL